MFIIENNLDSGSVIQPRVQKRILIYSGRMTLCVHAEASALREALLVSSLRHVYIHVIYVTSLKFRFSNFIYIKC